MITVEQLDIDQADQVIDLVNQLLEELREQGEIIAPDRDKIKADWVANGDRFTAFVALDEDGGRTMGVITLIESFSIYADGAYGVINELYVLPEFRCKKIGKVLIETAKEYGRQCGWKRIDVTAPYGDQWSRTHDFYLREGFAHTGPKLRFKL